MKALVRAVAVPLMASMALAAAVPAHADRGGHGGHGGYGYRGGHGAHHGHGGHHGRGHGGHGGIWGPLIVGGLIGAAIVGANSAQAQPVHPVVVPVVPPVPSHFIPAPAVPPVVVAPPQPLPPRVQYFCAPYRAYYPFVTNCPEPWYVMPY